MDEALRQLGFTLESAKTNVYTAASYTHPDGWHIIGADECSHAILNYEGETQVITSYADLLDVVYQMGVRHGEQSVKDKVRDMFGTGE